MATSIAGSTDAIDAPYTSSLLRYNTKLRQTSVLLITMRAVLPYMAATESASLEYLIQSIESLHVDASKEFGDLVNSVELLIRYEHNKPGRIFAPNSIREEMEHEFVSLGRVMVKMKIKTDELEGVRRKLLQMCGVDTYAFEGDFREAGRAVCMRGGGSAGKR